MASQKLLDLKAELTSARTEILPQIEGLHDFARLNIQPSTLTKVQEATVDFERRLSLLDAALLSLTNLEADSYPDVPKRDVLHDVYDDLAENVRTIEAAFGKFAPIDEAVKAEIIAGQPEQKPQ